MNAKRTIFYLLLGAVLGLGLSFILTQAGSIDFAKPGVSMWVYLTMAAFVLLLEIGPAIILLTSFSDLTRRPINWRPVMLKFMHWFIGLAVGFIFSFSVVWARSIDLSQAGAALWIFVGIGLIIVLLQLIPAIILFITFIGYATKIIHDKIPVKDEATLILPEDEKCECKNK